MQGSLRIRVSSAAGARAPTVQRLVQNTEGNRDFPAELHSLGVKFG